MALTLKELADSIDSVDVMIGVRAFPAVPLTARQDALIRIHCPDTRVDPKEPEYKQDADAKNLARLAAMVGTMLRISTTSFPDGPPDDAKDADFKKYMDELKHQLPRVLSLSQMNQVLLTVHQYEITGKPPSAKPEDKPKDPVEEAVGN